jgi:hypothetical protein
MLLLLPEYVVVAQRLSTHGSMCGMRYAYSLLDTRSHALPKTITSLLPQFVKP